jgi:hypothetical protein
MGGITSFIWRVCWTEVGRFERAVDVIGLVAPPVIQFALEHNWIHPVDLPWWAWVVFTLFALVFIVAFACARKAYNLARDSLPALSASFMPKGCLVSGPLLNDGSNATYVRVKVIAASGDRVTGCTPILARVERFDRVTRSFELVGNGDPLALTWSAEGGTPFAPGTVLRKVARYIDVLHIHENERHLWLDTQTKLFQLQRQMQIPGTYRLTVVIDPPTGSQEEVTIEVNWNGTWNGIEAYEAPAPHLA